ncbi:response regulator transcription factor [Phreatobacter aquaticus]|uniref:Response regulator transcription factor n=1 Tax=Phreatobacter aquaticus TaxID=2570229 RepID=A0A4D7QBL2_9HYPH|nr:response regulator transcription factor [Phreatobacter aquaticus]QCK85430.1 response regulator transcription factor [Phreatobacter aquaticus]
MRVLVVEDEKRIAADVKAALTTAGFVVETSFDGEDGWFRADSEDFDAIVLDLGLPLMDGFTILKKWRQAGRLMPVLLLTARDNWRDKVAGIDSGADDYLTKPFHMEELVARVRALTRRASGYASPILKVGDVEVDTRQKSVSVQGRGLALTPLEYRLLTYLIHQNGRVVSQSELAAHIYDQDKEHDSNALEVLVARLRKKLGVPVIETRRGHGYVISDMPAGGA